MPPTATASPFSTRARLARDAISAASVSGGDPERFLRRVVEAIGRAVPHDAGGWSTTDPGTMLWTGGVMHGLPPEVGAAFYDNELLEDDVLKFRDLVRQRVPAGVLSEATGGDLERS